ncbi:UNVERIFIED_CONTAM: hypothetical protein BEN50_10770 [Euhalothece sp. KZN 001]
MQLQSSLYEKDFYLWIEQIVTSLQKKQFQDLDLDNLITELESMGKREKRELISRLFILIEHLLKLQYWETEKEDNARGWKNTVIEQRKQIEILFRESPSLKQFLPELLSTTYQDAREVFLRKSELSETTVPVESPFTLKTILDPNYFP